MPSEFRPPQFEIRTEAGQGEKALIIKTGEIFEPVVQQFDIARLKAGTEGARPGAPAGRASAAGPGSGRGADPGQKSQRDSRFTMSQLTRDALFISAEESRRVEEQVQSKVSELAEEACARAREAGFEEGQRQGYEDAFSRFREEGKERGDRLESLITEMESAKAEIFRQNEKFLLELIFHIGKKVLLRELATDREYLVRLCSTLIEKTGLRENLHLRIHSGEAETIELLRDGIQARLGALRNLSIEASPAVRLGGCVLESDWGAIDASLETQLEEIQAALSGAFSGGVPAEE